MAEVDNFNLDTQDISEESFLTILQDLKFDPSGLLPAIVQDVDTGQVLMMAWMNTESLRLTLSRGETWFWSRSRQTLWHKGGSSGNIQKVRKIYYDCDGDTLLIQVEPAGPACHTGQTSCFYRALGEVKWQNER